MSPHPEAALLACPFCGGTDIREQEGRGRPHAVYCADCRSGAEAITAWNQRTPPPPAGDDDGFEWAVALFASFKAAGIKVDIPTPGLGVHIVQQALALRPSQPELRGALGYAFRAVWQQAEANHRNHSANGDTEQDIRFLTLGLTGEAGELANFVKKRWRDGDGHDEAIRFEIADVCAYAFMLANTMGLTPDDLIATIAEKQRVFVAKMEARNA